MTVVNHSTGEIVEFDRAAAERRAHEIETRLTAAAESFGAALGRIREAIEHRDDIALGYRSPGDYVQDRFGRALSGLPVQMRREAVRELTDAGLSTRAIAPVVSASVGTVHADRQVFSSEHLSQTPEPAEEGEAKAGSGHTRQGEAQATGGLAASGPDAAVETGQSDAATFPRPAAPVTGIDGKTYTRPAPSAPRPAPRRALTDSFFDAAYDLGKKAESVHRLTQDDRWPQNAEKVAAKHRNDLLRINDLLQQVISALPTQEDTHD